MTQVYARLSENNLRQALEDHNQRIIAAIGKDSAGKLIAIKKNKIANQKKRKPMVWNRNQWPIFKKAGRS